MHKIIKDQLKEACDHYKLSTETSKAIKKVLSRKMNGEITSSELPNDIARIFDLIKSEQSIKSENES